MEEGESPMKNNWRKKLLSVVLVLLLATGSVAALPSALVVKAKGQHGTAAEPVTKKELKDQNILTNTGLFQKKQVLKDGDINKDYFTQVDIRTTKEIKLYSKSADVLTTHPAGSYALEKDDKDQLVLKITNPKDFWNVSRYLVIQVK